MAIRVNDKTAVNVGFARYAVPVVVGQGTTSANTLAACQWCPGFNQTSTPLPFVEGPPEGISGKSVSAGFESSPDAGRQRPSGRTTTSETLPTGRTRITGRKSTIA